MSVGAMLDYARVRFYPIKNGDDDAATSKSRPQKEARFRPTAAASFDFVVYNQFAAFALIRVYFSAMKASSPTPMITIPTHQAILIQTHAFGEQNDALQRLQAAQAIKRG